MPIWKKWLRKNSSLILQGDLHPLTAAPQAVAPAEEIRSQKARRKQMLSRRTAQRKTGGGIRNIVMTVMIIRMREIIQLNRMAWTVWMRPLIKERLWRRHARIKPVLKSLMIIPALSNTMINVLPLALKIPKVPNSRSAMEMKIRFLNSNLIIKIEHPQCAISRKIKA